MLQNQLDEAAILARSANAGGRVDGENQDMGLAKDRLVQGWRRGAPSAQWRPLVGDRAAAMRHGRQVGDKGGIRIEQRSMRIEAVSAGRRMRANGPKSMGLPAKVSRHAGMPDVAGPMTPRVESDRSAPSLRLSGRLVQKQRHARGVPAEHRDIQAAAAFVQSERKRIAAPDPDGAPAPQAWKSPAPLGRREGGARHPAWTPDGAFAS